MLQTTHYRSSRRMFADQRRGAMDRVHSRPGRLLYGGFLLTFLCLAALLAACGTNGGTTTGGGTSPTPTQATVQQCGTIHTTPRGNVTDTTAAKAAEFCFSQAYQQCHPAKLGFMLVSLDSGVNRTFTINSNNGKCTITDAAQHYVVPQKPGPVQTYICTGLTTQADGLHLTSCGQDGNVVVPLTSVTGQ